MNANHGQAIAQTIPVARALTHALEVKSLHQEPIYGQIHFIARTGDTLWLSDYTQDPSLHLVDVNREQHVRSLLRSGTASGEVKDVTSMFTRHGVDSLIWIWDYDQSRLSQFGIASLAPDGQLHPRRTMAITKGLAQWIYPFGDRQFLATTGRFPDYFVVLSNSGSVLRRASVAFPGDSSVSRQQQAALLDGAFVCPDWSRRGFALAFRYADVIQYYDASLQLKWQVGSFGSMVRPSRDDMRGAHLHFMSCAFAKNQLFAIYAGRSVEATRDARAEGSALYVFSLAGELQRVFTINASIGAVLADSAGRTLFATSYKDRRLYRIDVPLIHWVRAGRDGRRQSSESIFCSSLPSRHWTLNGCGSVRVSR